MAEEAGPRYARLRWSLAAFALCGATVLVLTGGDWQYTERCSKTTTVQEPSPPNDVAEDEVQSNVETTCDPYQVADVLPLVALAALLLLPDLAEFEIPGLIRIRKEIERQREGQERVERELTRLAVAVTQNVAVNIGIGDLRTSAERVGSVTPEEISRRATLELPPQRITAEDVEAAIAEVAADPDGLDRLSHVLRSLERRAEVLDEGVDDPGVRILRTWRDMFEREATQVHAVAAQRARGEISGPEADAALELGRRLLRLLLDALRSINDADQPGGSTPP